MKSRAIGSEESGQSHVVTIHSKENEEVKAPVAVSSELWSRNLKMLMCFIGLQVSYLSWGVVQEKLMTHEYSMGRFKSSAFCVFGNRFFALFLALSLVLYKRATSNKPLKEAPYQYYAPSSLSNSISSWAQYESLKFISFPTQVLSKSCKLIPVMLVGILLNKKSYPLIEYLEAIAITSGVAIFTFSEKAEAVAADARQDTFYGMFLLALYLCCDSFTSQWQSRVYKQYGVDQYQMMLGVNIWSIILTGITLIKSGEFLTSLAFIMADSEAFLHMMVLSVSSATGQLFIFYTIKEFGPVIFTIMMTTRQIFSLVISCIMFSHPLSTMGWVGSLIVFGVVFNRIRRKGTD